MRDFNFWKRVSNYSIIVCGIVLIVKMFFRKYVEDIIWPILFIGALALLICLFSEIMKFIIKRKKMNRNYWKQFNIYEKGLALFFMINIVFDFINKKLLNSVVPKEIVGFMFWLSLGLYLGFQLCKYEYKRVLKKQWEEEQKEINKNRQMPMGGLN